MGKEKYLLSILSKLEKRYGKDLHTELKSRTDVDLFVAVFLSPQCTDKQVNNVTTILFKKYKSFEDYSTADYATLKRDLSGLNYYKTKARHLRHAANIILRDFNGKVPRTLAELMALPGVGRKVGNVVLNEMYGINEGIAVDTHCARVSRRLGFSRSESPYKIEMALMAITPKRKRGEVSNLFIALGRDTCSAINRKCGACVLKKMCPSRILP